MKILWLILLLLAPFNLIAKELWPLAEAKPLTLEEQVILVAFLDDLGIPYELTPLHPPAEPVVVPDPLPPAKAEEAKVEPAKSPQPAPPAEDQAQQVEPVPTPIAPDVPKSAPTVAEQKAAVARQLAKLFQQPQDDANNIAAISPVAGGSATLGIVLFNSAAPPAQPTTGVPSMKDHNAKMKVLREEHRKTVSQLKEEYQRTLARWKKDHARFKSEIPLYSKALVSESTFNVTAEAPLSKNFVELPKSPKGNNLKADFHVIPGALSVKIRDQRGRGTCAAFTGVRALETMLAQHDLKMDLSEQYFFWASKPQCQETPCGENGSWFGNGLSFSSHQPQLDIPLETNCPYNPTPNEANQTHTPLQPGCGQGAIQARYWAWSENVDTFKPLLDANLPILAGFTLDVSFYKAKGLVKLHNPIQDGMVDQHAGGHAMLVVGYLRNPESIRAEEGEYCYLLANSWGEGWGLGGYTCVTDAWAKQHYQAGVALTTINVPDTM